MKVVNKEFYHFHKKEIHDVLRTIKNKYYFLYQKR